MTATKYTDIKNAFNTDLLSAKADGNTVRYKSKLSIFFIWIAAAVIFAVLFWQQKSIVKNNSTESLVTKTPIEKSGFTEHSSLATSEYVQERSIVFVNVNKKYFITRYTYIEQPSVKTVSETVNEPINRQKTKPSRQSSVVIHKMESAVKPKKADFIIKPLFP